MYRTLFVAALGLIAVAIATHYAGVAYRIYAVGLVVALFGVWTVNELNAHRRQHWIVMLAVLIVYGALGGLVARYIAG